MFIDTYRSRKDDLPEGEVVLFLDAAHPTMATKLGYGWSIKGERKIVATTAGKKRINVIAILNPQCSDPQTGHHISRNGQFRDLGRTLRVAAPKLSSNQVFHASHHSGPRLLWRQQAMQIVAARLGIKLRHLLPYSPNLNLIERAWKVMKVMNEQVRDNVYFLNRWSNLSRSLTTRFADNFQVIQ